MEGEKTHSVELADFKEKADKYYSKLTEKAPHKGIGSNDYIRFINGVEWAFNHLPQTNYDKLKEVNIKLKQDKELLIEILKEGYKNYNPDSTTTQSEKSDWIKRVAHIFPL